MRLVRLEAGQKVLATVLSTEAGGQVSIGMFGARIPAVSHLQLEVGRTYEFKVAATEPQLVLSAAMPVKMPSLSVVGETGVLGVPANELGKMLLQLQALPESVPTERSMFIAKTGEQIQALSSGQATAEDLRGLVESLGHDQEQRVLRLPGRGDKAVPGREVQQLRETLKATILEWVASERGAEAPSANKKLAMDLLANFNRVEVDNARRSDQGGAIHIPLPLVPGSSVLDARLFAFPPSSSESEEGDASNPDSREWTIVLLLDLSRLGALRVDIRVGGEVLSADFQLLEFEPSLKLRAGIEELRGELAEAGFVVRDLLVRHNAGADLQVADLLSPPPTSSDPAAMVDLHV
ncbi:MAG: flagellar hook-length control protein FliK [Planctomycetota bacterium]|jgi:hypothetical protein